MMTPSGVGYGSSGGRERTFVEMNNIREEQEERLRLEKSNFDLKMKLFYLESNTKRERSQGTFDENEIFPPFPPSSSQHFSQSSSFIHQLEEKSSELEQRNQLLVRAKQAIEALKLELDKSRIDSKKHSDDLESQLRLGKLENDEVIYKLHENSMAFEAQMARATHAIAKNEHLREVMEEKLVSCIYSAI